MNAETSTPRTIAFIHGCFVSRHCWEGWVQRFEGRGFRCVAISYPGRERPVAALRANPDEAFLAELTIEKAIEHHAAALRALPEKPIVIGHSFGGLLTQLMVQRDLAAAAVAIDSVPPQNVKSFAWSFLKSLFPVVNPLVPVTRSYLMPLEHFRYTFGNNLSPDELRAAYDAEVVPESRRLARGGLSAAARIDFARPHAPLLMIAGEKDHIMPASLNRKNFERYAESSSRADFKSFPGRSHYSVIAGKGWEEVADYAVDWAVKAAQETKASRAA